METQKSPEDYKNEYEAGLLSDLGFFQRLIACASTYSPDKILQVLNLGQLEKFKEHVAEFDTLDSEEELTTIGALPSWGIREIIVFRRFFGWSK